MFQVYQSIVFHGVWFCFLLFFFCFVLFFSFFFLFRSLAKTKDLSIFSFSFIFTLWSAVFRREQLLWLIDIISSYHHHHVLLLTQISLSLSCHTSLSFIACGSSSGLHPVSSHSCWMYVRAGCPAFARPYVGVHRITSLMSSSLLLQQCPACLVCITWKVFVIEGRWPYSWCLVGCCRQDLFRIACSILV